MGKHSKKDEEPETTKMEKGDSGDRNSRLRIPGYIEGGKKDKQQKHPKKDS